MASKAANPVGRPKAVTAEVAKAICERIIEGESLREICESDDMPSKSTVLLHAFNNREFSDQYSNSRLIAGDSDADEISYISRRVAKGEMEPSAASVAIKGHSWSAARRNPKKYGNRTVIAGDEDAPVLIEETHYTPRDRAKALAALVAKSKTDG